jgi:hypothetical protein
MDHKEQHHEHHQKEREHERKKRHAHGREQPKNMMPFHPAWLVAVGVVLVLAALLVWTFLPRY